MMVLDDQVVIMQLDDYSKKNENECGIIPVGAKSPYRVILDG